MKRKKEKTYRSRLPVHIQMIRYKVQHRIYCKGTEKYEWHDLCNLYGKVTGVSAMMIFRLF